jgi:hypothetical protein
MSDDSHPWGAGAPETDPYLSRPAPVPPPVPTPAGWYPDPWSSGHHRYWDGTAWTSGAFPHGPATPSAGEGTDAAEAAPRWSAPTPPPVRAPDTAGPPPPPSWTPPTTAAWSAAPAGDGWGAGAAPAELASQKSRLPTGLGFVALVVGVVLVMGALGTVGGYLAFRHRSSSTPSATGPFATVPTIPGFTLPTPTVPKDPAAAALASLGLTQADVPSTVIVQPLIGGDTVSGAPTLDLCDGNYPSESLRTARLQVGAIDGTGGLILSTEAVLYANAAATEQALSELRAVTASCSPNPVANANGGSVTTHFNPAPDSGWAQVPTVTRQAYDLTTTDDAGTAQHSIAVYLRRGRVLLGVYFYQTDSLSVAGQTTVEKIVGVFAQRMAQLPASVVNG